MNQIHQTINMGKNLVYIISVYLVYNGIRCHFMIV